MNASEAQDGGYSDNSGEIQGDDKKALGLTVVAVEGVYSAGGVFVSSVRSQEVDGEARARASRRWETGAADISTFL